MGSEDQVNEMRSNYLGGNFGYGHAKQALFELILDKFKDERKSYDEFMTNPNYLEEQLTKGEKKAKVIAQDVLARVKSKIGY